MRNRRMTVFAWLSLLWGLLCAGGLWAGQLGQPVLLSDTVPPITRVRAASTGNVTISSPGTSDFDTINFSILDADPLRRILLWRQTLPAENGIYVFNGDAVALTRATDADEAKDFIPNGLVLVNEGGAYQKAFFTLDIETTPTLGTTDLVYSPLLLPPDSFIALVETSNLPFALVDVGTGTLATPTVVPYPELLTSAPGPGTCANPKHIMLLLAGTESRIWSCPNGAGSNPVEHLGRPSIGQICDGAGTCRTYDAANPDGNLNFPAGAGVTCTVAGTLPVVTVTCNLSNLARSIWIPASAISVSGGCTDPAEAVLLTNGPKRFSITCTDSDVDSVEFDWAFTTADRWNAGTIQVQLYGYSVSNQTTEVVEMDFAGQCVRDGDDVTAHSTTGEQAASVTHGAQTSDLQISAASSAITLQGTCNATSHIFMRGQIDATATTFSPMADWRLLGVKIHYVIN